VSFKKEKKNKIIGFERDVLATVAFSSGVGAFLDNSSHMEAYEGVFAECT